MPQHQWLDGALIVLMAVGLIGTLYHRIHLGFGIGDRAIQLVGICLVIPSILILGLEDKITKENIGTILGAIIGYVLSGIGSPDVKPKGKNSEKDETEKEGRAGPPQARG